MSPTRWPSSGWPHAGRPPPGTTRVRAPAPEAGPWRRAARRWLLSGDATGRRRANTVGQALHRRRPNPRSRAMSLKPLITVFGATGAQGGGLVRALLRDAERPFRVRAVTRRPGSAAAQALATLGAELFAADLDDLASVERAMQGAHGAYCVTNFWEHFSPQRELQQAMHLAEAARRAGVR